MFYSLVCVFAVSFVSFFFFTEACEKEYKKEYFEANGHQYIRVTGFCRGEVSYVVHNADCPCGEGAYDVPF